AATAATLAAGRIEPGPCIAHLPAKRATIQWSHDGLPPARFAPGRPGVCPDGPGTPGRRPGSAEHRHVTGHAPEGRCTAPASLMADLDVGVLSVHAHPGRERTL